MRTPLSALLLASLLPAQIVQLENQASVPFVGWVPAVVDVMPPHRVGIAVSDAGAQVTYVLGRQTGLDTRAIDLRVELGPGARVTVDLGKSKPAVATPTKAPDGDWLGGMLTIAGKKLRRQSLLPDGAGFDGHWSGRVGTMLWADVWLHFCGEPWARGEVLITCSNPSVPDMGEEIPPGFVLRLGAADTLVPGHRVNAPLIDAETWFGDGQARALPVFVAFTGHADGAIDWASIGALEHVHAVGIRQLLPEGNPRLMPNVDRAAWGNERLPESVRRLHTFEPALLGPNRRSADTGGQADQLFVAGEGLGSPVATWVCYLNALKVAARPCHHLEADGRQLSADHAQLVMWDSRPHWNVSVSPDRLGKPVASVESSGWSGADVEHWFHNNTIAAMRLTGSPCLQQLMAMQARIYPYQHTTRPDLPYQSVPFASRACGYEARIAVLLWANLEDRELAQSTKTHWLERFDRVIAPQIGDQPLYDWRRDDRLGPGIRLFPWQHAVYAYGLDLAGRTFGRERAVAMAYATSKAILTQAYWSNGTRWTCRDVLAQDGSTDVLSGSYDFFGSPLAIAVLMHHPEARDTAAPIWKQLLAEADAPVHFAWLEPLPVSGGK